MDLIDREQAIYMLRANRPSGLGNITKNKYAMLQFYRDLNTIEAVPPASKQGRWIWIGDRYFCSECSHDCYGNAIEITANQWHYCPNCGASMEDKL